MVKVKVEKKMNLLELLKWAQENDITNRTFFGHGITFVFIDRFGLIKCVGVNPEQIFTVNVEEEITEETKIPEMLEIFVNDGGVKRVEKSINELKDDFSKEFWLKDGNTMTLIWKDGELVGDE